ncbi:MAG: hypothetical protein HeimC2_17810 [Candidatus Heimdallarchaeota archaeon LC_2]|nr:MAG: hypothetical protein HeimC2_17810 [Candidatus Heimdallarchaeota archaeon LC_2]
MKWYPQQETIYVKFIYQYPSNFNSTIFEIKIKLNLFNSITISNFCSVIQLSTKHRGGYIE